MTLLVFILIRIPCIATYGATLDNDSIAKRLIHGEVLSTPKNNEYCHFNRIYQNVDSAIHHRYIQRLGGEIRPQYVFPTNPFLEGKNERWKPIDKAIAFHLKYSFKFRPNTCADRIYGGSYQGIGISTSTFFDKKQLGAPLSFYLFQGARIARFSSRLSLNYE